MNDQLLHIKLLDSIEEENVQVVEQVVNSHPTLLLEDIGVNNQTPLHLAALVGPSVGQRMIDLGAQVDIDTPGYTPLINAVHEGPIETVKMLLSNGANPNFETKAKSTPLFSAATSRRSDKEQVVDLLVRSGAVWDVHSAIYLRKDDICRTLLSSGPTALENAPSPERVFGMAVWTDRPLDIVGQLLECGANPDGDPSDVSPLVRILGTADCNYEMVDFLLSHGANPNALTPSGKTALRHYKNNFNDKSIIDLLVRYGAYD